MSVRSILPLFALTAVLLSSDLWCQELKVPGTKKDSMAFRNTYPRHIFKESKWSVSIPIWIPGFRGSFAYGDVDIDPGYGYEPPDFGPGLGGRLPESELSIAFYLIGNIRFQHNRWLIEAEGMSATLDNDLAFTDSGLLDFGGTIDATIFRGLIGYELYRREIADKLLKWSLWGYGGIRYYKVHVFANDRSLLDVRPEWTDPLIGVQVPLVYRRWVLSVQADYGGFGIDKHHSFYLNGNVRYRLSRLFSLGVAWSHLEVDSDSDYKSQPLNLRMKLSGPAVLLKFDF